MRPPRPQDLIHQPLKHGSAASGRASASESRAREAIAAGEIADFDHWLGSEPDVAVADEWDEQRTLTGDFVARLCLETKGTSAAPRGVRIRGARIVGDIDLATAELDVLLIIERCRIEDDISLRDAAVRLVNLARSRVMGRIDADRLRSSGGVYLRRGFVTEGEVRLSAAVIEGDLDCTEGSILSNTDLALRCDRMRVTGSAFLKRFTAVGEVRFIDSSIGTNLVFEGASLSTSSAAKSDTALLADNARVDGSLVLTKWNHPPGGMLNLRNVSARVLQLGSLEEIWPSAGGVRAQGFQYGALESEAAIGLDLCLRWLALLSAEPFSPQPYEKCSAVLREMGLVSDARKISVHRRRLERRLPGRGLLFRAKEWLLDRLIGYGYRPARSVGILAVVAAIGAMVFHQAAREGAMVPSDTSILRDSSYIRDHTQLPAGYPRFNAIVYSLDVVLPIIDFQQDSKWRPKATAGIGRVAIWWTWIAIALGWLLSTLLVASVTGLIRKE